MTKEWIKAQATLVQKGKGKFKMVWCGRKDCKRTREAIGALVTPEPPWPEFMKQRSA